MTESTTAAAADLRLDDHLCFALYSASMAVTRLYKPMLDEMGITYPQYLVLNVLGESDVTTIGGLAARLALDSSTVTPLVKRLEAAGLVHRRRSRTDERAVLVSLSDKGQDVLGQSLCLAEAMMTTTAMSPGELSALNGVVRSFADRLQKG